MIEHMKMEQIKRVMKLEREKERLKKRFRRKHMTFCEIFVSIFLISQLSYSITLERRGIRGALYIFL